MRNIVYRTCSAMFREEVTLEIGQKIRMHRQAAQLTMEELGNRAGVSRQAICKYEFGERTPDLATLSCIAVSLNLKPMELLPDWFLEVQCN